MISLLDAKAMLDSFHVVVDTREQVTERAKERYQSFGCPHSRATLRYGDYTYNCILPDGKPLYDESGPLQPRCVVERKMSLDELAGCLGRDRGRFEREFDRAREHDCRIYLLVEGGSWEAILKGRYHSKMNPCAFSKTLTAWRARYNMSIDFCKAETTGWLIREILYRDLKERIERGEFDGT